LFNLDYDYKKEKPLPREKVNVGGRMKKAMPKAANAR